jgi:hypothetical protein
LAAPIAAPAAFRAIVDLAGSLGLKSSTKERPYLNEFDLITNKAMR